MWQSLLVAAVAGSIGLVANHFFKPSAIGASQQAQQNGVFETHVGSQPLHKEEEKDDVFKFSSMGKRSTCVDLTRRVGVSSKRRKTGKNGAGNPKPTSSADTSFSGLGFGVGINKLNAALSETTKVVDELKTELHKRKSTQNLQASGDASTVQELCRVVIECQKNQIDVLKSDLHLVHCKLNQTEGELQAVKRLVHCKFNQTEAELQAVKHLVHCKFNQTEAELQALKDCVKRLFNYGGNHHGNGGSKLSVLKDPTGREIDHRYDLGCELGRGGIGVAYLCRDKETGESFACKTILKKKLSTAKLIDYVRTEVEIMKRIPKHPNIVSLKDTFEDDNTVYLVMDLCEGGELFNWIVARDHYTERAAASLIKNIVEVVQVCHKNGVMHRDLKPENFLFANKRETAPLKVIDFGLSTLFKPGERFTEIVGSPNYMAPEVLKRNYGPEIDIWSAGVILYILLCGFLPFHADTEQGVAQAIMRSAIDLKKDPWPKVSNSAKDLVMKMLDPDPQCRLTAQEVLDHPWLQSKESSKCSIR